MSMYTPGPWLIEANSLETWGGFSIVSAPSGEPNFAVIAGRADWPSRATESAANARLIAAAPELLEACKRLLQFNEELCEDLQFSTHYPSAECARQAIVKAEGR